MGITHFDEAPSREYEIGHALEPLDMLAFGLRRWDEATGFPRLGMSLLGRRMVRSEPGALEGAPAQFVHESHLGPPELPPAPGQRPATVVNVEHLDPREVNRPRISRTRRNLGVAAGSITIGLQRACHALGIQPRWMRGARVVQPRPAHVPGGRPEHVPAGGCAHARTR